MLDAILWWVRRDMRLIDNPALQAAVEHARAADCPLLPVFIADPHLLQRPAALRQNFLWNSLAALDVDLRRRGSFLLLRHGDPVEVLQSIHSQIQIKAIYVTEDTSPYARRRDAAVARCLPLHSRWGLTVQPPLALVKQDGTPYRVFTPFRKAWLARPAPGKEIWQAPFSLPAPPVLSSQILPVMPPVPGFSASEQEAQDRLQAFRSTGMAQYALTRDRLDVEGTSALSPYLRFGLLSPRQAALEALRGMQEAEEDPQARAGAAAWLNELIWREFYHNILYFYPWVLKQAFNPALRQVTWRDAPEDLARWQNGQTGYPVVDAAMRQLAATGWMFNRARMVVASFLVKDLLLNWQDGERWFMQQLVDGDPAANNGGWQWTAGVGVDAAPYFRVFNPVLQGQRFDPAGEYVRRWVPELAGVPTAAIHQPWVLSLAEQQRVNCLLGRDYPLPVVEHHRSRERVVEAFTRSREQYQQN